MAKSTTNGNQNLRTYYTTNPTVNADNTITVSFTAATDFVLDVTAYDGTDTTTVIDHSTEATGNSETPTVTFSLTNDDSLVVFAWGQVTNSALTSYGTGQTDRGIGVVGGAEKLSAGFSDEIVTATGSNDQSAVISKSEAWLAHAIEFNTEAAGAPVYNIDLLDVYESSSTTLDSGTAVCTDIDTDSAQDCTGNLVAGNTYRFELEVDNTGGGAGSPTDFDYLDLVAASDVFGSIDTGAITDYGCGTNSDWTGLSIATGDVLTSVGGGTACSISAAGNVEYWVIVTLDSADASYGSGTFFVDDGSVSDTSFSSTTFPFDYSETGTDTWTFTETTDAFGNYIQSGTDTFGFTESDGVTAHYIQSGTDTWTFAETTNAVKKFIRTGTDTWSFVDSSDEVYVQVRTATDTFGFIETTDESQTFARSGTDTFPFVETHSAVGHFVQTGTDTFTFVETTDVSKQFVASGTDTFGFVETTDIVTHFIQSGTDTFAFVETTTSPASHNPITSSDVFAFVESTQAVKKFISESTDTFGFVETTDIVITQVRTESDVWTFVDSADVEQMAVRTGTDTFTFVETTDVVEMSNRNGVDVFAFVETTDVVPPTPTYQPAGKYIWFNCTPASNSTVGCIYAFECPAGEFVTGFNEEGVAICAVP